MVIGFLGLLFTGCGAPQSGPSESSEVTIKAFEPLTMTCDASVSARRVAGHEERPEVGTLTASDCDSPFIQISGVTQDADLILVEFGAGALSISVDETGLFSVIVPADSISDLVFTPVFEGVLGQSFLFDELTQ